jgi:hypothetical protein
MAPAQHLAARSAPRVFAFHCPNGGWRSPIEAAIMKGLGVRAGVPDVVAVRDGHFYGLELKATNGCLSAVQREAHAALIDAGATVQTVHGLDAARVLEQLPDRHAALTGNRPEPLHRARHLHFLGPALDEGEHFLGYRSARSLNRRYRPAGRSTVIFSSGAACRCRAQALRTRPPAPPVAR